MSIKQDKGSPLISLRVGLTMEMLAGHGSITTFDLQKPPSKRRTVLMGMNVEVGKRPLQDNVARWN